MSGRKVSLTGEVHISTGSIYTTVDALEAMKCVGLAYGLYDHAEEFREQRVCQRHLKMSFSAEIECHFSLGSIQVYTALITGPLVGLKPVKS